MNDDPTDKQLREILWRRDLTEAERAELCRWLESHPEAQAEWETEKFLSAGLNRLPDAPVPSNFTARVMQRVEREVRAQKRETIAGWISRLRFLVPRVAVVALVLCAGIFMYHRQASARNAELAQSLVTVTRVEALPGADSLEDFDAIRRMSRTAPIDEELLALLQ